MSLVGAPAQPDIINIPLGRGYTMLATPEVMPLWASPEWPDTRQAVSEYLGTIIRKPFGPTSIHPKGGDLLHSVGHSVDVVPAALGKLLGDTVVVKGTLHGRHAKRTQNAHLRADLLSQLTVMQELASLQREAFPDGLGGLIHFNVPYAGLVHNQSGRKWLFMQHAEGKPLVPAQSQVEDGMLSVRHFSAAEEPDLANFMARSSISAPPDRYGSLSLGPGLSSTIAAIMGEATGHSFNWFARRLTDLHTSNVLASSNPDGSARYTIIDMQMPTNSPGPAPVTTNLSTIFP